MLSQQNTHCKVHSLDSFNTRRKRDVFTRIGCSGRHPAAEDKSFCQWPDVHGSVGEGSFQWSRQTQSQLTFERNENRNGWNLIFLPLLIKRFKAEGQILIRGTWSCGEEKLCGMSRVPVLHPERTMCCWADWHGEHQQCVLDAVVGATEYCTNILEKLCCCNIPPCCGCCWLSMWIPNTTNTTRQYQLPTSEIKEITTLFVLCFQDHLFSTNDPVINLIPKVGSKAPFPFIGCSFRDGTQNANSHFDEQGTKGVHLEEYQYHFFRMLSGCMIVIEKMRSISISICLIIRKIPSKYWKIKMLVGWKAIPWCCIFTLQMKPVKINC